MRLELEFTYRAKLAAPVAVGPGPYGMRSVVEVTGGDFDGARLRGEILTGGADWLLVGADGFGRLDVRTQLRTHDGAAIYMTYTGVTQLNEKVQRALAGGPPTDFADHYVRATPVLETGDPRYAWVNRTIFVSQARFPAPGVIEYHVYRVL